MNDCPPVCSAGMHVIGLSNEQPNIRSSHPGCKRERENLAGAARAPTRCNNVYRVVHRASLHFPQPRSLFGVCVPIAADCTARTAVHNLLHGHLSESSIKIAKALPTLPLVNSASATDAGPGACGLIVRLGNGRLLPP